MNSNDPIDILNVNLKRFKKHFKGRGSNLFGHVRKKKKELKEELANLDTIEEIGPLSPEDYIRRTNILLELHEIYADEELYWLQRSNERWLLKGDQNSAYLHRVATGRKRKNTVSLFEMMVRS